jgi:hypothetical protein
MSDKPPPLGIPQDVEIPPGLSPGAIKLFKALQGLHRHGDPDQMMRDLDEGKTNDE